MKKEIEKCKMLSVKELLCKDTYMIPMYQRNYAWEKSHLDQLIQDVWDSLSTGRNYYIGTLIAYLRNDGKFETVDGQQRLTTLNIILCSVLHELEIDDLDLSWYERVNISYEYRERSTETLNALYRHDDDEELNDSSIKSMYDNVKGSVENIIPRESLKDFFDYMFNKVMVTRVILPSDTDLNHYFEIMNSRGEQLEKHEILKALMLRSSKENGYKNWLIGQIWEACSDMERYVPLNFSPNLRNIIFSEKWNVFNWASLDDIVKKTKEKVSEAKREQFSISDVIKESNITNTEKDDSESERFESVIKFQGFLLHVLRVMTKKDIPLDDKRLIQTFSEYISDKSFADQFILKMLELRFLFDKFVIKRDYKDDMQNGKMNLLTLTKQKESYSYNLTYSQEKDENDRVIMAESMFHVSLPSQNYKHWLCAVLNYINEHKDGKGLSIYLEKLAKIYMFGRFISDNNQTDNFYYYAIFNSNEIVLNKPEKINFPKFTEHIDFFIFNFIDYCIWTLNREKYKNFEFTSRSSIEHFYPQHPKDGMENLTEEHLHDIGNLCLISASKNSELSNYSPSAKTEHYLRQGYDSLKQALMIEVINKNKAKSSDFKKIWWIKDIEEHHKKIEEIVIKGYNNLGE